MNRTAVDYRLEQTVVLIRSRIDRPRFLSCITELLSYALIQEIGAGHELSEQSESCRIVVGQFGDELCGGTSISSGDQTLESVRQVGPERQHAIEAIASHSGFARGRKPFARRNQDVGELREHGTFVGIDTHTGTF
jgi:hypothetical protein